MGLSLCKNKEVKIMVLGLDAAGKTSMLYQLKLGEVITTIPTIGFTVETVKYKNYHFTTWDVGGRCKIRPLYRHYYQNTDALIFVVDSNDRERIGDASDELHEILANSEMKDVLLLVLANKQDLPGAMNVTEVTDRLELNKLSHEWYIQPTAIPKGSGIYEALDWLTSALTSRKTNEMLASPVNQTVSKATELTKKGAGFFGKSLFRKLFA